MHSINKRNKHHLHGQNANLICFQKTTFCASINIFNSLPRILTSLENDKAQFKVAVGRYLNAYSFQNADEFVICKDD
jgi:hypothetical protein